MYLEFRRVSLWSAAKMGFAVHILLSCLFIFPGALLAIELALLSLLSPTAAKTITNSIVPSSAWCGIAVFLLNAISGAIAWVFAALVFNTAAWMVGGPKLKFRRPKIIKEEQNPIPELPEREETPAERHARRVREEMERIEQRRRK